MKMKLTTANIDLPEGKSDLLIFDEELSGFWLRVRRGKGGRIIRNWMVAYRVPGHQRRMVIGDAMVLTAKQARKKAKELLAKVELGGDPQGEQKKRREDDQKTFRSVAEAFLEAKEEEAVAGKLKMRSVKMLRAYLLGPLGRRAKAEGMQTYLKGLHSMPIDRITRADVAHNLRKHPKESIKRGLRNALNGMFVWAMEEGETETNPVMGTKKPEPSGKRKRVLQAATSEERPGDEIGKIWKALEDDDYGKATKLMILTGCRRREIGKMHWSEFSADGSSWTLPEERSKNGVALTLPVTPLMREVLDTVWRRDGHDNLFGRRELTSWDFGKKRLDEKVPLPAWQGRDIRRSLSTGMADLGVQPHVIDAVTNHQSQSKAGITGVYNLSPYAKEVRIAMALWSDHIRALVEGTERKVVPLVHKSA